MHGHGVHRFNIIQTAWQHKTDTSLTIVARERHA